MTLRVINLIAAMATLAGCNTVQGIGQDVERGGEAISDTAGEVQEEISN